MEDVEFVNCNQTDLYRLRDLKLATNRPLIVDASETNLSSLNCHLELGERILQLNVRGCRIISLIGLSYLKNIEELNVTNNQLKLIQSDREDSRAPALKRLLLNHNNLGTAISQPQCLSFVGFPALVHLDLSNNFIKKLDFVTTLSGQLKFFNFSDNKVDNLCEFHNLRCLFNLEEIYFDGNPCTSALSDYKLLILTKAIVLGKLQVVNKITINEREELFAEKLHVNGIRKFKSDQPNHDTLVAFVKDTLGKISNKELEAASSQQRINAARKHSFVLSRGFQSSAETTPVRRPAELRPCSGLSLSTSTLSNLPLSSAEELQKGKSSTGPSNTQSSISTNVTLQKTEQRLNQLFSMYTAQQEEIANLRLENQTLKTELGQLHEAVEKHATQLCVFEDLLSIVPAKVKIKKRSGGTAHEYLIEWENELKALHNVKGYELQLGDGKVYTVQAPYKRVIIDNPVNGQKISLRAVQKTGKTVTDHLQFIFKAPDEGLKENKENCV